MGILSDVNLLLKGYEGKPSFGGTFYISPLSNPDFSRKYNLVLPDVISSKFNFFYVSSCNGLLFLDDFTGNSLIWNPSSGEHKLLPPTCLGKEDSHPAVAECAFCCSGFGFDPKSEDYKAVRFLQNYFEEGKEPAVDEYRVELYSLNSDSWKPISYSHQAAYPIFDQSTYIDGFYFWVASGNSNKFFIISFNFADEEFSIYPMPYCYIWGVHGAQLIEFDGSLAVVIYPASPGTDKSFDIWVWNGEYWTKKFSTEPLQGVEFPLGFSKNGKHMFLEGPNHQFLHYDLETKELKDTGIRDDQMGRMQLIHYDESSAQLSGEITVHFEEVSKL
ncbi:hypothetical protein PTKIN_Ptkin02bG0235200 [Pterospermum kingtungense]